ncbi:class I SAM-dependent methyltransferase [Roseimaritima sediminicola]|uniref:class I SAM-dependent methyltransferase n=1 Tax=Roseimaritima sediminicola TaxID=2662066 RepID=UPI0012984318|nr:class I SAM-dependent methyltransferase [Roseimaritima sediminicola]
MQAATYQLIDFGEGRKLESLGDFLIDRPSPAALHQRARSDGWARADARFDVRSKRWSFRRRWPESLFVDCGPFRMPVQPTPFGHIGLFPEQHANWQWLHRQAAAHREAGEHPFRGLNLFAYTGASSLAIASGGGSAVHVDAAKPNVAAAKRAAAANHFDDSIRFLTDDARKFVARELRRGRVYDLIVLDPPAYGHGPGGKAWRLERDLWPLLDDCLKLLSRPERRLLVTGHSEQVDHRDIQRYLTQRCGDRVAIEAGRSSLPDAAGRRLDCGFSVRATWSEGQRVSPSSNRTPSID